MPKVSETLPYRIYNEDCFQTFARILPKSVDLVLCDPPYGTTQCSWDSVIPIDRMWREIERVLKPNGVTVLTAMQPFSSALVMSNPKAFKYEWIWRKSKVTGVLNANHMPMRCHEQVLVFYQRKCVYNPQGLKPSGDIKSRSPFAFGRSYGDMKSGSYVQEFTNYPSDLLEIPSSGVINNHPNEKPVKLMEYFIKTYTNPGETVLDFAMGSGTTGVACMHLGRKFIGCDSDTEHGYFETARLRIMAAHRNNWGK